jgi:class 3 adenylate cyclase
VDPRIEFLKRCDLFAGLPEERLEEILAGVEEVEVETGCTLFNEGEQGDSVYLVREGRLLVVSDGNTVATRGMGECIGEFAIIDEQPRSASTVADAPSLLFKWQVPRFREILEQHAGVAQALMRLLTSKLREDVASHVSLLKGSAVHAAMRSYVPGAIADQLDSGADLEPGVRDVSVLFVDIRGYTTYAEGRRAEEIFSMVSSYTQIVSQIVRKNGGAVVEFNGDGMMAVFGAPRALAHKEQAAVEAGREIVAAVKTIPIEDAGDGEVNLSVGVGIATGEAFVGNIQAADRLIWSAIGNTTNLAARLQQLTRELGCSLAIDSATHEALGAGGANFERHEAVTIRGRQETQNVYSWRVEENTPDR